MSPQIFIGSGTIPDPDTTSPEPQLCATIQPNDDLISVLLNYVENDPLMGLGGIDYGLLLEVGDAGVDPSQDHLRREDAAGHAADPGDRDAEQQPVHHGPDGVRRRQRRRGAPARALRGPRPDEHHAADRHTPTTSCGSRRSSHRAFTRSTSCRRSTAARRCSPRRSRTSGTRAAAVSRPISTGGPVDCSATRRRSTPTGTRPTRALITDVTDVPLFIIQRDDRLGEAWFETCT